MVPDVEEAAKWGAPAFLTDGKILLIMAAFKAHAAVNFWRGKELGITEREDAMGQLGKLTAVDDLPADLDALIGRAVALNAAAPAPRKPKTTPKPSLEIHPDFVAALAKDAAAKATLDGFSPSARRDYLDWIAEAKRDDTRAKRISTAIGWLREGKKRHWKYENC